MSDAETPAVNRTLLAVLIGVAVLALLYFFVINPLLLDGQDTEPPSDGTTGQVDGTPTPAPTGPTEVAQQEGDPPAETFEIFNARDPFQQLVPTGGGGTEVPTDGATDGTEVPTQDPTDGNGGIVDTDGDGTVDSDDPDDDGDGIPDDTDTDDDGDGTGDTTDPDTIGEDTSVGGTRVSLVDVFTGDDGEPQATVSINGTAYTVSEGDIFASRFRLLDISGACATMLFGDNRFTLCEGDTIRK